MRVLQKVSAQKLSILFIYFKKKVFIFLDIFCIIFFILFLILILIFVFFFFYIYLKCGNPRILKNPPVFTSPSYIRHPFTFQPGIWFPAVLFFFWYSCCNDESFHSYKNPSELLNLNAGLTILHPFTFLSPP